MWRIRSILFRLLSVFCVTFSVGVSAQASFHEWIDKFTVHLDSARDAGFFDSTVLPFAFEYGGRSSDELLSKWKSRTRISQTSLGEQRVVTWEDPKTSLQVVWTVLLYDGFEAAEMRLSFENHGHEPSEVLRNVLVLRQRIVAGQLDLVYARGGGPAPSPRDLESRVKRIGPQPEEFHLAADMGWPAGRHLPFWLLLNPEGEGFCYGVGWTGQWVANFTSEAGKVVRVAAGMEHLNLRLKSGERISQPTLLLGHFTGGRLAGHNLLRRVIYRCYVPRLDGKRVMPPVYWMPWGVFGISINEDLVLNMIDKVAPLGLEFFPLSSGWCNVEFWDSGDWRVSRAKFPHGLEPVSVAMRSKGIGMGITFDPERVTRAAYDQFEHKEWLRPANNANPPFVWLVDFGLPQVRRWCVNLIGGYVRFLDLAWLEWDSNYPPLEMWQKANSDDPERVGIEEIRYIEGLYEVWDSLLKNYPKLFIELSAAGGRRFDLETVRHSHTLWKSDFVGDSDQTRVQLSEGNLFLPANLINSDLRHLHSVYDYYCQFGGPLGLGLDFRKFTSQQIQEAAEIIRRYKEVRRYLVEDYYPLFDRDQDPQYWDGWQFHDPKDDSGFFLVFRLSDSTFPPYWAPPLETVIKLKGVDPKKGYTLIKDPNSKAELPERVCGTQLQEGLRLRINSRREALLVRYRPAPNSD